jgi:streptogramin lyase
MRHLGQFWAWSRVVATALAVCVAAAGAGGAVAPVASALPIYGGEVVIIDSVTISGNAYAGVCDAGNRLAIPVTVTATFIPPPGSEPVGPYAVVNPSAGFGSADNHFGEPQGHAVFQVFHLFIYPGSYSGGTGTATVTVQDVGVGGGYAERDDIQYKVPLGLPYRGPTAVKCPLVRPATDYTEGARSLVAESAKYLVDTYVCEDCLTKRDQITGLLGYSEILEHYLSNTAIQDPPDNNYQQIAVPSPPPVLPPLAGLTASQRAAVVTLESELAAAAGDTNAMAASIDRAWGAGNAADEYWYHAQMSALARFAVKTSAELRKLPAGYAAVWAAFGPIPSFPVTEDDVSSMMSTLVNGLPGGVAAVMRKLGVSAAVQQQIAQEFLNADPSRLSATDGARELLSPPEDYDAVASALVGLASWAAGTISAPRPAITSLSERSGPASGGVLLTVYGSNLDTVTGMNFGQSTTDSGLGAGLACSTDQCSVAVPPGAGTVDVTASGPGGPSRRTSADRFSYVATRVAAVTRIFPATGSLAGGTSVSIWGSGLAGGAVFFGPDLAQTWTCTETLCTATSPPSAGAGKVDVKVWNQAGTSALSPADRFSFTATAPPPPTAPTVTGMSPASGDSVGGDQVTIIGKGFTGATAVDFGGIGASGYTVLNDTHITATTPARSAGTADVTVYNSAGSSTATSADHFKFVAAVPVVTAVSPRSGATTGGTRVTITGKNLNQGYVSFGLAAADFNSTCTPTRCTATAPAAAAGVIHVQVDNDNGDSAASAANRFTYVRAPAPVITSVEPANGSSAGGTTIAIFGTNLTGATVTIGGQYAESLNGCAVSVCAAQTPPGRPGPTTVVVTRTDGSRSRPAAFSYVRPGPPSISAVEPRSGWLRGVGQVEVIGQNLANGTVYIGGKQASFQPSACTQTECSATAPFGAHTGTVGVSVRTVAGATAPSPAARYTYVLPTIRKVSPSAGWTIGGEPVTITGTSLSGGFVSFGTTPGSFTCTDTVCTGTTPLVSSPGLVNVSVAVAEGLAQTAATPADHFTYKVLPPPTVTSLTPGSGIDQGGDQVVVTGTYLDGGTVYFGGTQAVSNSCTDTRCTAITPYHSTDGPVNVTVKTSTATSPANPAAQFTYHPPGVPTVTGVHPASGTGAGGTPIIVTGTNMTDGVVEFNGQSTFDSSCLATSCTAVTLAGNGTANVQVATSGGTSAITPAATFTYTTPPAPTVTGLTPANGPSTGGSFVTVTGTNLANGTVMFGGAAAIQSNCGASSCVAEAPAGAVGAVVDVTVKTLGGTSPVSPADRFAYLPISLSESTIPGLTSGDNAEGGHVYAASDGTTWFTVPNYGEVCKIAPAGAMTCYPTPDPSGEPDAVTQTPDGTVWYTEYAANKIVSLNSAGHQTGYQIPGERDNIAGIAAGPDGRLWFTLYYSGTIGAMTTSGTISLYQLPNVNSAPVNIVVGPDRRLWFTEGFGDAIGAITTGGRITDYPVPGTAVSPWGLAVGPDGRLWFADQAAHELGAMTASGVPTRYPLPASDGSPIGVTLGPDGRVWFTQGHFDQVSALSPANGAVTDYPLPEASTGVGPRYLAMARDGSLWASDFNSDSMIHVTGLMAGVKPAVTSISPGYGPTAGGTTVTITGANLGGATAVRFGSAAATKVVALDAAHVLATVPPGHGTVDVTMTTPQGTSTPGVFRYGGPPPASPAVARVSPAVGSTAGGTKVRITGANLAGGTVRFGGKAARGACAATSCSVTAPPGAAGTVDVRVTAGGRVSAATPADEFTYQAPAPPAPVVASVSPASGPVAGGGRITVRGAHLGGGTVTFGLNQATASCTAAACTVTVPPGGPGTVDLRVTTAGGMSAVTKHDRYTYRPEAPDAPGQPAVRAGVKRVTVSWAGPPYNGGSPVTGYTLIVYRNGVRQAVMALGTARSKVVTGLTAGASYTFVVRARNEVGTSAPSPRSAPAVPT